MMWRVFQAFRWVSAFYVILATFPAVARPVIASGYEPLFLEMARLGPKMPSGARLEGVSIERDTVTMTYNTRDGLIRLHLVHPDTARDALARTKQFAVLGDDKAPSDLVSTLVERIRTLEGRFDWSEEVRGSKTVDQSKTAPFAPTLPEDAIPFELMRIPLPTLPERAEAAVRRARDLLAKGEKKAAAQEALSLVQSHPEQAAVLRVAGSILRSAEEAKHAVEVARKVLDLPGGSVREAQTEFAASLIAAGRFEEALAVLTRDSGTPAECRWVEALTLLALEGRGDLSWPRVPPFSEKSPRCVALFHLKMAHARDDDDSVDRVATKALTAFPDDEAILYLWGYHYYSKRAMDRAIPPWERLVTRNPRFPALLGQYGTAYLVAQRLDRDGVDRMLKRVNANPDDLVASFLAGLGLYYLKEYERVVPLLEPVVRAVPDESRARLYLAMAHYFLGHQETAERMFDEMEPYAYQDPDIYYCRSLIYRKRDLPRAIREMERFLEVFVGEGRLSFGPEKVEKARSDLERMRRGEIPELNLPGDPLVPAQ